MGKRDRRDLFFLVSFLFLLFFFEKGVALPLNGDERIEFGRGRLL